MTFSNYVVSMNYVVAAIRKTKEEAKKYIEENGLEGLAEIRLHIYNDHGWTKNGNTSN